jgi:hypothetical protein
MADAPGPFWVREAMPLGPRVTRPREFEGLAADLVRALGGVDAGLGGAVTTIAPLAARELDTAYAADVAPAFDGLATLGTPEDAAAIAAIARGTDDAAAELARQAADVPGADEADPTVPGAPPPADPGPFPGLE